jgi:hypothetical protein
MKLRRHGTPAECAQVTRQLLDVLHVVDISHPYPDRGSSTLVRVSLDIRLPAPDDPDDDVREEVEGDG